MLAKKNYYECHITMLGDKNILRPLVEQSKWKFSAIDGDPVLGDGIKCYATMFYSNRFKDTDVLDKLLAVANDLAAAGAQIIRKKIEFVIWDERDSGDVSVCDGNCVECKS